MNHRAPAKNIDSFISNSKIWIIHLLVKLQNMLVNQIVTFGYKLTISDASLVRLGSPYGGWWIPQLFIDRSSEKRVAICSGIGHDVSFDKELLISGFTVIALDPLQECISFARQELSEFPEIHLENLGLASYSGEERFFAPKDESHDSWSSTNSQNTEYEKSTVFQVISLQDLLAKYNNKIINSWSLLKMDVEGAECEIIPSICDLEYSFSYIAIEMDFLSLIPFLQIRTRVRRIIEARELLKRMNSRGYKLIKKEHFNYFWIFESK